MDNKIVTFLTLCELMNYRKTAEALHLTQPAVTKQVQALEAIYGVKLFIYDGKSLSKTDKCIEFETYCKGLRYNHEKIVNRLAGNKQHVLKIGVTKSIGEDLLMPYILKVLDDKNTVLNFVMDNTKTLLEGLDSSSLDFAVVEGSFSRNRYDFKLLKSEEFVGICSPSHPFAGGSVSVSEIFEQVLIAREVGSGSRRILENEVESLGYCLDDFARVHSVSHFPMIKAMVARNLGISFVYKNVISNDKNIATFKVDRFLRDHEINIVFLKGSLSEEDVERFFCK